MLSLVFSTSTEALSLDRKYQSMKLTIHPQLELRLNFMELYLHSPYAFRTSTGTALSL
jgi:hypothetical protein